LYPHCSDTMIFYHVPLLWLLATSAFAGMTKNGTLCTITPSDSKDDSPALMDAFKQCGHCDISIRGKLTWNDDIQYWLRNSIGVTYSGRSTAWRLGGENFTLQGHGQALFFGNGQKWYDQNKGNSNQNGRPISLTLWKAKNVWIDGITWRQPQFW
jgi:galacturan 1,4-alpha-galacturonidase